VSARPSPERPFPARTKKGGWRILGTSLLVFRRPGCRHEAALRFGLGLGIPFSLPAGIPPVPIINPARPECSPLLRPHLHSIAMECALTKIFPVPRPEWCAVLFVGDSLTYGNHPRRSAEHLHTDCRARAALIVHHPVEVLNASANGWAPDNEWSWVRTRGIFHSNSCCWFSTTAT